MVTSDQILYLGGAVAFSTRCARPSRQVDRARPNYRLRRCPDFKLIEELRPLHLYAIAGAVVNHYGRLSVPPLYPVSDHLERHRHDKLLLPNELLLLVAKSLSNQKDFLFWYESTGGYIIFCIQFCVISMPSITKVLAPGGIHT